jgi:hypothetical protein
MPRHHSLETTFSSQFQALKTPENHFLLSIICHCLDNRWVSLSGVVALHPSESAYSGNHQPLSYRQWGTRHQNSIYPNADAASVTSPDSCFSHHVFVHWPASCSSLWGSLSTCFSLPFAWVTTTDRLINEWHIQTGMRQNVTRQNQQIVVNSPTSLKEVQTEYFFWCSPLICALYRARKCPIQVWIKVITVVWSMGWWWPIVLVTG